MQSVTYDIVEALKSTHSYCKYLLRLVGAMNIVEQVEQPEHGSAAAHEGEGERDEHLEEHPAERSK